MMACSRLSFHMMDSGPNKPLSENSGRFSMGGVGFGVAGDL
jgi:hypothetical protein